MDAHTTKYHTHGTSETLKKLYCLNLTKQQERDYKVHKETFQVPFDTSLFTETEKPILQMFNLIHQKLKQEQFEHLAPLLIPYKNCYATSKFDSGKSKVEYNLPWKVTVVFKKQRATGIPYSISSSILI